MSAAETDPSSVIVTVSFPRPVTPPETLDSYKALTSVKAPEIDVTTDASTVPVVLASIAFRSPATYDVSVFKVMAYTLEEDARASNSVFVEASIDAVTNPVV